MASPPRVKASTQKSADYVREKELQKKKKDAVKVMMQRQKERAKKIELEKKERAKKNELEKKERAKQLTLVKRKPLPDEGFNDLFDRDDHKNKTIDFSRLEPVIRERLMKHHNLYPLRCKAEYWEAVCAVALKKTGYGSDWKPDFNHKSGVDQTTFAGVRISNKGGIYDPSKKTITISSSRTTGHACLKSKLNFLSKDKEDYIFCLAGETKKTLPYYFAVIDSRKLRFSDDSWTETLKRNGSGTRTGWKGVGPGYVGTIQGACGDQLWLTIDEDMFDYFVKIDIKPGGNLMS